MSQPNNIQKIGHDASLLFNEVFGKNMPEEVFFYKHFSNPDCLDVPVTYACDDNALVSMQWYQGIRMMYNGQEFLGAQVADSASLEKARGFPFLQVFMEGNKVLKEQGVAVRFETPNTNSFPIVTKLGDAFLGNFSDGRLEIPESGKKGLKALLSSAPWKNIDNIAKKATTISVSSSEDMPFAAEDFETINAVENCIMTKKSPEYLTWRVVDNTWKQFVYYKALEDGRLVGYFIVQINGPHDADIVDWLVLGKSSSDNQKILACLLKEVTDRFKSVQVAFLNDQAGEVELYRSFGFDCWITDNFCIKTYSEEFEQALSSMARWRVRKLDVDYFLNYYPAVGD